MTSGPALDASTDRSWWRHGVVYQIYVRSFADADGDGVGDLAGIRQRLPHLVDLGVDALWLTPFYPSPQADGGYDVADYRAVDPQFGDLADFDALVAEAHRLDLKVVVDIVPNHTSDQHPWFQAALAAGPGSPERARYHFRPGKGPDGDQPPNDWLATFGGDAWTRVTEPDGTPGEWYLHLFTPEQPDLNWEHPDVVAEFEDILRFWLDRGVDGFRIDVAHGLAKQPGLPDAGENRYVSLMQTEIPPLPMWDQDAVHAIYQGWRRVLDSYPGDRMTVGEVWLGDPHRVARYTRPDELHQAFNFRWLFTPFVAAQFRDAIDASLRESYASGAPVTWVLGNHDVVRPATRYADPKHPGSGLRRARAALLTMLALPGAAYLYQGEELGLPEVDDLPEEVLQDPIWERTGHLARGRDGCRVPIPWSGTAPPFGFGPDGARPWLPQPETWAALTVAAEHEDPASTLSLVRRALRLRREIPWDAGFEWLTVDDPHVLAFRRGDGLVCALNMGSRPARIDTPGGVTIASGPVEDARLLPPDTAVWFSSTP